MPQTPTRRSAARGRELQLRSRTLDRRPCRPNELFDPTPGGLRGRFRVTLERLDDDTGAVILAGELDLAALPALDSALRRAEAWGAASVFVDTGDVGFVDLSVVRRLAASHERLKDHGGELLVVNPPECLLRILDVLEDLELQLLP